MHYCHCVCIIRLIKVCFLSNQPQLQPKPQPHSTPKKKTLTALIINIESLLCSSYLKASISPIFKQHTLRYARLILKKKIFFFFWFLLLFFSVAGLYGVAMQCFFWCINKRCTIFLYIDFA